MDTSSVDPWAPTHFPSISVAQLGPDCLTATTSVVPTCINDLRNHFLSLIMEINFAHGIFNL